MVHHSESLSIKYNDQKFCIKIEQDIEQDCLSQNMKKIQFKGCFIKIWISVLDFISEWAIEPATYDLLFLIAIYFSKNNNKHPFEIRN